MSFLSDLFNPAQMKVNSSMLIDQKYIDEMFGNARNMMNPNSQYQKEYFKGVNNTIYDQMGLNNTLSGRNGASGGLLNFGDYSRNNSAVSGEAYTNAVRQAIMDFGKQAQGYYGMGMDATGKNANVNFQTGLVNQQAKQGWQEGMFGLVGGLTQMALPGIGGLFKKGMDLFSGFGEGGGRGGMFGQTPNFNPGQSIGPVEQWYPTQQLKWGK
jgi:hypothetical protein